jgi:hypothetical protein
LPVSNLQIIKLRVGPLAALGYADKELFTQLANEFPSNTYIIFLNNDTKNLEKKLRKIEGAAIYPQKRNNEDIRNTA